MIILYDKNETSFTSFGLGVLSDAISCQVNEELNGGFELELKYPINGKHYSDIELGKIIFAKPNQYDNAQAFRIYEISKPINGIVTIYCEHISYDMSGLVVLPFSSSSLTDALSKIQNGSVLQHNFVFNTDKVSSTEMKTKQPYNMRSLLAGQSGSILDIYGGEYKFDNFNVYLKNSRGSDKGVSIRYGKNMKDVTQTIKLEKKYTGVYPFYFSETQETTTGEEKYYQQVYIVKGTKYEEYTDEVLETTDAYIINGSEPFTSTWLSLTSGGGPLTPEQGRIYLIKTEGEYYNKKYNWNAPEPRSSKWFSLTEDGLPFIPIIDNVPVRVESDGEYNSFIYIWSSESKSYIKVGQDAYIVEGSTEYSYGWLSSIEGGDSLEPNVSEFYIIKTKGDYYNKIYKWSTLGPNYIEISDEDPIYFAPTMKRMVSTSDYSEKYVDLKTSTDAFIVSGVEPYTSGWLSDKNGGAAITPNSDILYKIKTEGEYYNKIYSWNSDNNIYELYESNGIIYIDEESDSQRILTLDMSSLFSTTPPTVTELKSKANEYIRNNKIGEIVDSIKVSFIKLSDSEEYTQLKNLEKVELGDTVEIIYEKLGINSKLEVIKTSFNPITEKYISIELGTKSSSMTDNSLSVGDSISSLVNDKDFADYTTVKNLIAETLTAEYLEAKNSKLTQAQIEELKTTNVGAQIIEANTASIDTLVSKLLTVENAEVSNTLKAGDVVVKGTIYADAGEIGECIIDGGKLQVEAANIKSLSFGGELDSPTFEVDSSGKLKIKGECEIESAKIGNSIINEETIKVNTVSVDTINISKETGESQTSTIKIDYLEPDGEYNSYDVNFSIDSEIESIGNKESINRFTGLLIGASRISNLEYSGNISFSMPFIARKVLIDEYELSIQTFITSKIGNNDLSSNIVMSFDDSGIISGINFPQGYEPTSRETTFLTALRLVFNSQSGKLHIIQTSLDNIDFSFYNEYASVFSDDIVITVQRLSYNIKPIKRLICTLHTNIPSSLEYIPSTTNIKATFNYTGFKRASSLTEVQYSRTFNFTLNSGDTGQDREAYADFDIGTVIEIDYENIELTPDEVTYDIPIDKPSFGFDHSILPTEFDIDIGSSSSPWDELYVNNAPSQTSDKNKKNSISYDIDKYSEVFDKLKPTSFKYNNGTSGRTHLGLIAQDVEEAIVNSGMDTKDYAILIKDDDNNYSLRYGELHALEILEIQKLKKLVKELENKINK